MEKRWWGTAGACASSSASSIPPIPDDAITGLAGSAMVFDYEGHTAPDKLQAIAYPLGPNQRRASQEGEELRGTVLPIRRSGKQTEISARLATGEYAIRVATNVLGSGSVVTGEASYGFRIVVR